MFRNAIRLPFRILGIPIQLDVTFLLFLPLLGWMIASNLAEIAEALELELDAERLADHAFLVGLTAAAGLFLSVLVHEFGHAAVGLRYGLKVRSVTLWLLGGLAEFESFPKKGGVEAIVAIAGPITSVIVGAIFLLGLRLVPQDQQVLVFLCSYLGYMNIFLAVFNLIPALPLDGGRVLRSLLALRMSYGAATRVSTSIGKFLALLMALTGFVTLNPWFLLLAFFVFVAGQSESTLVTVQESLRGLRVADLMNTRVETVTSHLELHDLFEKMLEDRYIGYPVIDLRGQLVGMVSLADLKRVGRGEHGWSGRVADIMTAEVTPLSPDQPAADAFQSLAKQRLDRLAVVDAHDQLVGIISHTDLLRAVQVRMLREDLEEEDEEVDEEDGSRG